MTEMPGNVPGGASILAVATRNAGNGGDLAIAAGQVIARRVALGVAAVIDPLGADHREFERLIPEKLEAFAAAGIIMLRQTTQASQQITRFAAEAVMTATHATIALASCSSPAALAKTQSSFAFGWFDQASTHLLALGMLAVGTHEAMLAPIHQTVAANARRLVP